MKVNICDENLAAREKLPSKIQDRSGIGVYYVDAYLKPMNITLADGTKVACKRRGLKIMLSLGDKQGLGLMRRIEGGPDPEIMLRAALQEAAEMIGAKFVFEGGTIFLET
jgi:hypothetical protein